MNFLRKTFDEELRLREICEEVRQRVIDGQQAVSEGVLKRHSDAIRCTDQVIEVIYSEYTTREDAGEVALNELFLKRFPQHQERLKRLFDVHSCLDVSQRVRTTLHEQAAGMANDTSPASQKESLANLAFHDRFIDVVEVGSGGMGVVYRAKDTQLGRTVALKRIHSYGHNVDRKRNLVREANATCRLQHPNVVQIFEFGETDEGPFLVMEWIEGVTLAHLTDMRVMAGDEAARLLLKLALAVQFAHNANVVHRDIKPTNILLTGEDEPKIVDFGLAKILSANDADSVVASSQTQTGAMIGTPAYMAPEQVTGIDVTASVDIYALGAVLFEILVGRPPFQGATTLETLQLICDTEPPIPSQLQPNIPVDLETICLKCLRKEPAQRYPSAQLLADDLQRFLERRPIKARRVGQVERLLKWTNRNPVISALLAIILFVTIAGLCGVTWQWREAERGRLAESIARKQTEKSLYFQKIALAQGALEDRDYLRAREILGSSDPQHHNWEWKYLDRLSRAHRQMKRTHKSDVRKIVFSPDGQRIITASSGLSAEGKRVEGTDEVIVFEAVTGKVIGQITDFGGFISDVDVSPDGNLIAVASQRYLGDGPTEMLSLWDTQSLEKAASLPFTQSIECLCFTHDGTSILTATNNVLLIWDLATKQRREVGHTANRHKQFITDIASSPNRTQVATSSRDGTVKVWELPSGQLLRTFHVGSDTRNVTYNPDGTQLVAGGYQGLLTTWDLTQDPPYQIQTQPFESDLAIMGAAFSADGLRMAIAYEDGTMQVLDARTRRQEFVFKRNAGSATCIDLSPDGRTLVAGSNTELQTWQLLDDAQLHFEWDYSHATDLLGHPDGIHGFLATRWRKGTSQLSDDEFVVLLRHLGTGKRVRSFVGHQSPITRISLGSSGDQLATSDLAGTVRIWDVATAKETHKREFLSVVTTLGHLNSSALLIGDENGQLTIWDFRSLPIPEHIRPWLTIGSSGIADIAIQPNGHFAAVLAKDGAVFWVDIEKRKAHLLDAGRGCAGHRIAMSVDGLKFATSHDGRMVTWQTQPDGHPIRRLELAGNRGATTSVAFNRDGSRLASVGDDRIVRIWDWESGLETLALDGAIFANVGAPRVAFCEERLAAVWSSRLKVWSLDDQPAWEQQRFDAEPAIHQRLAREFSAARQRPSSNRTVGRFAAAFHRQQANKKLSRRAAELQNQDTGVAANVLESLTSKFGRTFDQLTSISFRQMVGKQLYDQGRYEESIAVLHDVIRSKSDRPAVSDLVYLSLNQHELGNHAEAKRLLDEAELWDGWYVEILGKTSDAIMRSDAVALLRAAWESQPLDQQHADTTQALKRYPSAVLLKSASTSNGRLLSQSVMRALFGPLWIDDRQLWWVPETADESLTIRIDVEKSGEYLIEGGFTLASDYGIFQLKVNGQTVGDVFDGFNPAVIHSGNRALGKTSLMAGKNEFVFDLVGKNRSSSGFMVGIDYLQLSEL